MSDIISHPFDPVFDINSKILILGSFPSIKSRENMFYYGHPQNRFWKIISALYGVPFPEHTIDKVHLLHENGIALWDVIDSCTITGSSDSTINNVVANDIRPILAGSAIKRIYTNGTKAYELYNKYTLPLTGISAVKLPSSSPANAAFPLEKLIKIWMQILD